MESRAAGRVSEAEAGRVAPALLRVGLDEADLRLLAPLDEVLVRATGAERIDVATAEGAILRWDRMRRAGRPAALLVASRQGEREILRLARLLRGPGRWAPVVLLAGAEDAAAVRRAEEERCCDTLFRYALDADRLVRSVRLALEVAERRLTEEGAWARLAAREREIEAMAAGIDEGLLWIDDRRRVTRWNRRAEEIFGLAGHQIAGRPFAELGWVVDGGKDDDAALAARLAAAGSQLEIDRPDGTRAELQLRAVRLDGEGSLERQRLVLVREMASIPRRGGVDERRLLGLGRLAASVVHDVNNLLVPVLGYAELLRARLAEGSRERAQAAEIERSASYAAELLRRLLDSLGNAATPPQPIHPDAAVERVLPLVRTVVGPKIAVVVELGAPDLTVAIRAGDLEQILLNLATNAREALAGGGTLTVRTSPTAGTWWQLEVADDGAGISSDHLARLFEAGFSTKPRESAGGLGLWIVRGLVEAAGGRIQITSAPGAGARAEIKLPVIEAAR